MPVSSAKIHKFAPNVIEPIIIQGTGQFGNDPIQIRLKMMTKPGEQFVVPAGRSP